MFVEGKVHIVIVNWVIYNLKLYFFFPVLEMFVLQLISFILCLSDFKL